MNVIPTSLILLVKCNKGDTWKIYVAWSNREHMKMYNVVTISLGLLLIIFISRFLGIKKIGQIHFPFYFIIHSFVVFFPYFIEFYSVSPKHFDHETLFFVTPITILRNYVSLVHTLK